MPATRHHGQLVLMKYLISIILLILFVPVYSQKALPGGVRGADIWQITESTGGNQSQLVTKLQGAQIKGSAVKGRSGKINNNPALYLSGSYNMENQSFDLGRLRSFSLFTVCQESDTLQEKIILSFENDSTAETVLTDRRLAALDIYRYSGYMNSPKLFPAIYSYIQNRSSDTAIISRRLLLGQPPQNQRLPASAFRGVIPEFILFGRAVSPRERQQVESYLAIKYGISLSQEFPASYLNSAGQVIWDAESNPDYNHNITGIGRDDLSDLKQVVSENNRTPGVMKISARGEMDNNSFFIWSDNGEPLRFNKDKAVRKLHREWKITAFNCSSDSVGIETDIMSLSEINPLNDEEAVWLMIDRSGTGKYPFGQTDYIQSLKSDASDNLFRFTSLIVDPDSSGSDVFTLVAAPHFFARSIILSPSCMSPATGVIRTEIAGGTPPFDLELVGISDTRIRLSARETRCDHIFNGIRQGSYLLNLTDSEGRNFTEKIFVSNYGPWEVLIGSNYTITDGEIIVLDASAGMPALDLSYSWTIPGGSKVTGEKLAVDRSGTYLLSVTDQYNCNIIREVNIKQSGSTAFSMADLYPNPVNGWFTVRISLKRVMDVSLMITDMNGRTLKQTRLSDDMFYRYTDIISKPGNYFIILVSGNEKVTLKLIVL